jgi:hypothetical protein
MTTLIRLFTIAATAAFISATPAFAKECCDAATAKTKSGETCEKCEKHACCQAASKTAAADMKKAGKAVECKTCAAKKDAKKPA